MSALQNVDLMVSGFTSAIEAIRARNYERAAEQVEAQTSAQRISHSASKVLSYMRTLESENNSLRAAHRKSAIDCDGYKGWYQYEYVQRGKLAHELRQAHAAMRAAGLEIPVP
jgi:hypothetical protein